MHLKIIYQKEVTYLETKARTPQEACEEAKDFIGHNPDEIHILQFKPKEWECKNCIKHI